MGSSLLFSDLQRVASGAVVIEEATKTLLNQLSPLFQTLFREVGCTQISCIEPKLAVLEYVVNEALATPDAFCTYTEGFTDPSPTAPQVDAFIDGMNLVILDPVNSDAAAKQGFLRSLRSRMFRVHAQLFHHFKQGSKGESPDDDTPLPSSECENILDLSVNVYGYKRSLSDIPNLVTLQQMRRGFANCWHKVVSLKAMRPEHESKSAREGAGDIVLHSGTKPRQKPLHPNVSHVVEWLIMLRRFCLAMEVLALGYPAPASDWGGNDALSIVRGTRYHWGPTDSAWYFGVWLLRSKHFWDPKHLAQLSQQEELVRSTAFRISYDDTTQLASAFREAVKDCAAKLVYPKKDEKPRTGQPGGGHDKPTVAEAAWKRQGISTFAADKKIESGEHKGKFICKFWTDGRSCYKGSSCEKAHVCDVLVEDGNGGRAPCLGDHKRAAHK